MPKIKVLNKHTAELIAAGEVVERPASAIKELVENSIDAGAKRITVEIKRGGVSFMRVTDDGCGIQTEDVETAFLRHATSKISSEDDLNNIMTLGFRGEALASISAVSRVEMLTCAEGRDIGTRYQAEGGEVILKEDAGCPKGTTIIVRDLFYNTPARMKFLKKDAWEGTTVAAVIDKIALSHPEIAFRFIKEGKCVMQTTGDGDLKNTVYAVCGKDYASSLIPAEGEIGNIKVSGFISRPSACRNNKNGIFVFLNGRYVFSKTVIAALDRAYQNSVMVGRFPAAVLFLTVPYGAVDVNVHPAKTEVRFSDDKVIWETVYFAAKNAIASGDIRKKADISRISSNRMNAEEYRQMQMNETAHTADRTPEHSDVFAAASAAAQAAPKPSAEHYGTAERSAPSKDVPRRETAGAAEYTKVMAAAKEGFANAREVADIVRFDDCCPDGAEIGDTIYVHAPHISDAIRKKIADVASDVPDNFKNDVLTAKMAECSDDTAPVAFARDAAENTDAAETAEKSENGDALCKSTVSDIDIEYLGEAFRTYLIVRSGDSLFLIDKHAAHERMIFNRLMVMQKPEPQLLLVPYAMQLTKEEFAAVCEWQPELEKAGFEIEEFGESSIIVRSVPSILADTDIGMTMGEIIGNIMSRRTITDRKTEWVYHSVACRAAVKAGNINSPQELAAFAKQVLSDKSIMYCPHGRPVAIELTRRDIEKQFGRIQ